MIRHADVGIVGAGPAGSRAAELLAGQGVSVVLFDPDAPWEKPCGGGLTPPLFDEVPELEEIKSVAAPADRAWLESDGGALLEVKLLDRIWVVSRRELGSWQLDRAIRAGASHEAAKVVRLDREGDRWVLSTSREEWRVGYLVGADGAASKVRSAVARDTWVELVPARVAYPQSPPRAPGMLVLRFYRDLAGYLWDFPRPDHRSVGIELTGSARTRAVLDASIDEYGGWNPGNDSCPPARAGAVIGTAQRGHGDFSGIAGRGYALVGDAAGLADPLTGEGIRNAFRSAAILARARRVRPQAWSATYSALARETFAKEFAMSRFLRRWLSETGLGVRLVEHAMCSDVAYGLVAAVLGAVTYQRYGALPFLSHLRRALGDVRANPGRRGVRTSLDRAPVP